MYVNDKKTLPQIAGDAGVQVFMLRVSLPKTTTTYCLLLAKARGTVHINWPINSMRS